MPVCDEAISIDLAGLHADPGGLRDGRADSPAIETIFDPIPPTAIVPGVADVLTAIPSIFASIAPVFSSIQSDDSRHWTKPLRGSSRPDLPTITRAAGFPKNVIGGPR